MCCKLLANAKWTDIRSPDKCQQCCSVFSGHVNSRTDEGAALDWHCQCLLPVHDNRNDDDNADDAPDDNDAVGEHDVDVDGDGDADDDGEDNNENDNINVSIANVLLFL